MHWTKIFSTLLLAAPALAANAQRAVWMWHTDKIQTPSEVNKFVDFTRAHDIGVVYAYIDNMLPAANFRSFVSRLTTNGISVEALIGEPEWVERDHFEALLPVLDWLKEYQNNAPAASQFKAVHMDVEPWNTAGWKNESTRPATVTGLLRVAEWVIDYADKKLNKLPVHADLPFWANETACPGYDVQLDVWMFRRVASLNFMTYRSNPDLLLDVAERSLSRGVGENKPGSVWLSMETTNVGADQSYYGRSLSDFNRDQAYIESKAKKYSSYAGLALHDYEGVAALH